MTTLRVLLSADAIRPGGGPPGYVFNLLQGARGISEKTVEYVVEEEVRGDRVADRGLSTLTTTRLGRRAARRADSLSKGRLKRTAAAAHFRTSGRHRQWIELVRNTDIALVQGYQDSPKVQELLRAEIPIVYMPHSPSVMAHEQLSVYLDANVPHERWRFKRMLEHEKLLIGQSSAIVFPSVGASEEYVAEFGDLLRNKPIYYIRSGVGAVPNASTFYPNASDPIEILFAGRHARQKGYDLYCEAAEILSGEGVRAQFTSIGTGPLPSSPAVKCEGWTRSPEQNIARAQLIVIPNRVAYYDLLPLECASLGRPLVFTPVGGNVDQAADLPDTLLSEAVTPRALANAIRIALSNIRSDALWGQRNKEAYYARFTSEAMAHNWQKVLHEIWRRTSGI